MQLSVEHAGWLLLAVTLRQLPLAPGTTKGRIPHVLLGNSSQTLEWREKDQGLLLERGKEGSLQPSRVGCGDFKAALGATPYLQVIMGFFSPHCPHQCPSCVCTASADPDWAPGFSHGHTATEKCRNSARGASKGSEGIVNPHQRWRPKQELGGGGEHHDSQIKENKTPRCAVFLCQPD